MILVDTRASDADADIIMDALRDMDHKHSDLKLCVLTHRHGDHTGGLKKLKKTLKFEVMAHELDMPAIQTATGYDVEHVVKGERVCRTAAASTSSIRRDTQQDISACICRGSRR